MKRNWWLGLGIVLLSALLVGYLVLRPAPQPAPPKTAAELTPKAAATELKGSLVVKGSDTMVHLVSAWAEEFMKVNPGVEIAVTGGGSGTGIAALINQTTDICSASRPMSEKERQQAQGKGVTPQEFVVARDGVALVVNPANQLDELTMEQLKQIFTGDAEDWSAIGGRPTKIGVISRESSSGTYVFFQEHVMAKKDYSPRARLMPATAAIIQAVSTEPGAIGYVGLGYAAEAGDKVKVLRVKADANSPAVTPSEATVRDGTYPVARPLFLYTPGQPGAAAKAFIDFTRSEAGQKIVRETGYVPLR